MGTLPAACAKVLRFHIEGWDVKEIAQKLGKSQSTVYTQKQKAIDVLKSKLKEYSLKLFIFFI